MIKCVGNCNDIIDWNRLILDIKDQEPAYIGPSHNRSHSIPGIHDILDIWDRAEYKLLKDGGTVGWDMFLPDRNFDRKIVDAFAEYVGVEFYNSAWISRVNPGMVVPYHWDVHDHEEELLKLPNFKRWHCHVSPPTWGHAFFVDNECFYNQQQGATYEWNDRRLWHAGSNCGLVPKYTFNFW